MAKLTDLIAQKAALEQEIEALRSQERQDAVAKVRALMAEHGLTLADLSTRATPGRTRMPSATRGSKVPPKYRNTATGETWSGRGLQPKWLKAALASGKKLTDFAV
jgi:DNA-binding protein H-NS